MNPRSVLIAGIGNVFLGDDGFGVETVRALSAHELPDGVEAVDFGVRGVHLAYQLLDGYDTLVLVDATARGGAPGTLYLIEAQVRAEAGAPSPAEVGTDAGASGPQAAGPGEGPVLDGHHMSPDTVLALLDTLCAGTGATPPRRTLVLGCEPACVEEGIGLSAPVAAAVPEAVRMALDLLDPHRPAPDEHGAPGRELRRTP
ncbi:hydrogenase maturation protease [Streptomyces sp. NRRL F-2664]|uniref:hydrogenase maturation protease n=1 Tax=Streptomyces sp. NRRL F-2664 TaxID=1463842 RepID=UPI00068FBF43|nr:hydrogenase maturation protease [Streptomyces sp. NRRL F-2664]